MPSLFIFSLSVAVWLNAGTDLAKLCGSDRIHICNSHKYRNLNRKRCRKKKILRRKKVFYNPILLVNEWIGTVPGSRLTVSRLKALSPPPSRPKSANTSWCRIAETINKLHGPQDQASWRQHEINKKSRVDKNNRQLKTALDEHFFNPQSWSHMWPHTRNRFQLIGGDHK